MADVFISYATEDRERVTPIVEAIDQAGFSVWWDLRIELGSSFDREIERELNAAACVVVIWSKRSIESEWVRNEAQDGLDRDILLPILIDDIRPPLAFRRAQTAHFSGQASTDELSRVVSGVESIVTGTRERSPAGVASVSPTRTPVRWALVGGIGVVLLSVLGTHWWLQSSDSRPAYAETSIAVLPFDDLSPGGDQRWLANGMTESLVVYLSRVEDLRVTRVPGSGGATQDAQVLGERLEVGSVVLGSVQRSDEELIVTARMASTTDGVELWSGRYERALDDMFDVQREIAQAIVGAIESELGVELHEAIGTARYRARDVRAYELWRKSLDLKMVDSFPSEADLRQALEYNLEAVAIDPEYSMGYVGLGTTLHWLWVYSLDPRDLMEATQSFERAVELDPENTFARASLVTTYGLMQRWAGVVEQVEQVEPWTRVADLSQAISWYVQALINLGRWDDANAAIDELSRAVERSPDRYPGDVHLELAYSLVLVRGDYDTAIEVAERSPYPARGPLARLFPHIYHAAGHDQKAVESLLAGLTKAERKLATPAYTEGGWLEMLRAVVAQRGRTTCKSVALFAALGESELMYDCLERSLELYECMKAIDLGRASECRAGGLEPLRTPTWTAPPFNAYRGKPRFQRILDRSGVLGYKTCCPFEVEDQW